MSELIHIFNMNSSNEKDIRALAGGDLVAIERIVRKNGDDLAVAVERGLERLEERIDAAETRVYGHLTDMEERASERAEEGIAD